MQHTNSTNLLRSALIGLLLFWSSTNSVEGATSRPELPQPSLSAEDTRSEGLYSFDSEESVQVLHDQTDFPSTWGISSQNFEDYLNAYDSEAADDFVVPDGYRWHVNQVDVRGIGTLSGSAETITVRFYTDDAGFPGSLIVEIPDVVPTIEFDIFTITLSSAVTLESGTYWVSVQANKNYFTSGQWYWTEREVATGNMASWRNPGNGFGTGCVDWQIRSVCEQSVNLDQIFRIIGSEEIAPCPRLVECTSAGNCLSSLLFDSSNPEASTIYSGWMDGSTECVDGPCDFWREPGGLHLQNKGYIEIENSRHILLADGWRIEVMVRNASESNQSGFIFQIGDQISVYHHNFSAGSEYTAFLEFQYGNITKRFNFNGAIPECTPVAIQYVAESGRVIFKFGNQTDEHEIYSPIIATTKNIIIGAPSTSSTSGFFNGDIDYVTLIGSVPCNAVTVALAPEGTEIDESRIERTSRTGASPDVCDNVNEFAPGDIVNISIIDPDPPVDELIFFDWRRTHGSWDDLFINPDDTTEFFYADRDDSGELDEVERRNAGWYHWRYKSQFDFIMSRDPWYGQVSFVDENDIPTISRFPVRGPHNTGLWPDNIDNHIFGCDLEAVALSNGLCHDGSGVDIFSDEGIPIVATTNGNIHFACNDCGGVVAYLTEEGGDWRHYFAHMADTCWNRDGTEGANPCADHEPGVCGETGTPFPPSAYNTSDVYHNGGCENGYFEDDGLVTEGDVIGFVGRTGAAYNKSAHLHFELLRYSDTTRVYPVCLDDGLGFNEQEIISYPFLVRHEMDPFCEDANAEGSTDVVLLMDTTRSMQNALAVIQSYADYLLNELVAMLGSNVRVAVADYRDDSTEPYGGEGDYRFGVAAPFSEDHETILAGIQSLDIGWGGDQPESVFSALIGALRSEEGLGSWRTAADKYIVLIGDAPPHLPEEPYWPYYSFEDVLIAVEDLKNQSAALPAEHMFEEDARSLAIQSVVLGDDPTTLSAFSRLAVETDGDLSLAPDETAIVEVLTDVMAKIAADANPDEDNTPPVTGLAEPSVERLWPPNHDFYEVEILGVTDPDGDPVRLAITSITQDELVSGTGSGRTAPDASGIGGEVAQLRAERDGSGDGRVYEINFVATDGRGGRSTGSVRVCVPHDKKDRACGNDGQVYDSTIP